RVLFRSRQTGFEAQINILFIVGNSSLSRRGVSPCLLIPGRLDQSLFECTELTDLKTLVSVGEKFEDLRFAPVTAHRVDDCLGRRHRRGQDMNVQNVPETEGSLEPLLCQPQEAGGPLVLREYGARPDRAEVPRQGCCVEFRRSVPVEHVILGWPMDLCCELTSALTVQGEEDVAHIAHVLRAAQTRPESFLVWQNEVEVSHGSPQTRRVAFRETLTLEYAALGGLCNSSIHLLVVAVPFVRAPQFVASAATEHDTFLSQS